MLIEVFKSGTHTDSNGVNTSYSLEQINQIVQNYNNFVTEHPNDLAPLVKGHPQNDAPAFGWVKHLVKKNSTIFADIVDIDAELISDIEKKKFKNFSIALYPNLLLRHIGILGAVPPAVKGLNKNGISFFHKDANYCEYEYSTNNDTPTSPINTDDTEVSELQKLKEENAQLINKLHSIEKQTFLTSIHNFADSVCNSPNSPISSSQKNALIDILEHSHNVFMADDYSFAYSESNNGLTEKIKRFILNLSNEKNELCSPLELQEYSNNNAFEEYESHNVRLDTEKNILHKKALNYILTHPDITYSDAVNRVIGCS